VSAIKREKQKEIFDELRQGGGVLRLYTQKSGVFVLRQVAVAEDRLLAYTEQVQQLAKHFVV